MAKRVGDLVGQRFGMLEVIGLVGKDKFCDKIWRCKCDCGAIVDVKQGHLRSGHTMSCGCQKPKLNDFTGRRFGSLVVEARIEDYVCPGNHKHYVKYRCKCDCGNVVDVLALNLKQGSTRSCGCQRPHGVFDDLSGRRFGKLLVQARVDDYINPSGRRLIRYRCLCDCGREVMALANTLRIGDVMSCGCSVRSKGEDLVRNLLAARGIPYELHKTFDGCVSDAGGKLSYDFYLPMEHALIECNGEQHYVPIEFFGGMERFATQVRHDELKLEYARCNEYAYLVLDCRNFLQNEDELRLKVSEFIDMLC